MKNVNLIWTIAAIVVMSGCNTIELPENTEASKDSTESELQAEEKDVNVADSSAEIKEYDINILPEPEYISELSFEGNEREINDGINQFSLNLFTTIARNYNSVYSANESKDNISISPLSVAFCLGLMSNAVDDTSRAKILNMVNATDINAYNRYCNKLMRYLPNDTQPEYKLVFANSAWLSNAYKFNDSFTTQLNSNYNAEVYNMSFADPITQEIMDYWCAKKTEGTINKSPIDVDATTVCVLLNALYFNAEWYNRFSASETQTDTFKGSSTDTEVEMMHNALLGKYLKTDTYESIKLPYFFNNFEMVIILPNEDTDINEFSKALTYEEYAKAARASETYSVNLSLPKFNIKQDATLIDVLAALGLPTTNVRLTNAGIDSALGTVIRQSAYIDVNEVGSTISAVTGNGYFTCDGSSTRTYPKANMKVNRPFLYFVHNTETGSILMAGRVCNL
jgi:serpin B